MGRFDATTEAERRDLVADAIAAHRRRESAFTTMEAASAAAGDSEGPPPWVQFDAADALLNLDCTDAELDRLEGLLEEFGGCTIHERTTPDDAEGTNVRVRVRVDDDRVAQLVERLFREVYDRPADYRLWVADV